MQQAFDVQGPIDADVRLAAGQIEVDASGDASVTVELVAHDEESQRLVDNARVELGTNGSRATLLVDVPQRRSFGLATVFGRGGLECRIRCPQESGLRVRTKSADVSCRGTLGSLGVTTASGDVDVEHVAGDVDMKSASSDFAAREIGGAAAVQTASGDIEIEVARGRVDVTSVSGDITIGEAHGDVRANSVSGDQDHRAVSRGVVSAHSVSGDVAIGVRRGSTAHLDCTTVSGDTRSDLELSSEAPAGDAPLVEIRAKTVSGDIRITRAPAPTTTQEVPA